MSIQYYAALLLTIMALVSSAAESNASVTGSGVSVTENSVQDTDETYDDLLKQIQAWEESKSWEKLVKTLKAVKQWMNQENQNESQKKKLSMLFLLLNRMDYHYTGVYRTPQQGNILPKTTKEPVVSGMSPVNIKDPEVRKQYEEDLEENEKENQKANFQIAIRNRRESWLGYIALYLMNSCKDEEEITKLIDDNVTTEKSRKELKEIVGEEIRAQKERMEKGSSFGIIDWTRKINVYFLGVFMLAGKIIVAIVFGGLSFWCWKDIWNGLIHQKLSPFHRGYPPILRKDGKLCFWARFYNVLGLSVFSTCMLSMILLSEVTQWSYWEIILLRIGIIAYCLGEILQIPYRLTAPIVAYRNKSMSKITKFSLIIIREMLVFIYMAGIITLGVYFLLYVKK